MDLSLVLTASAKDCHYAAHLIFVSTNVQMVLDLNKGKLPNDTGKLTEQTGHFTQHKHAIILSEVCTTVRSRARAKADGDVDLFLLTCTSLWAVKR